MTMCRLAGSVLAAYLALYSAHAFAAKLMPEEQLEQACDAEGMSQLKADKVIAYTFKRPKTGKTTFVAPGAAFRRHGEWYRLSFTCETTANRDKVTKFTFKEGKIVPHNQWEHYYLYP